MLSQHFAKTRTDGEHSVTAARIRSAEFAFRKRFGHFERAAFEIDAFPSESQNFADSHSGSEPPPERPSGMARSIQAEASAPARAYRNARPASVLLPECESRAHCCFRYT